MCFTLVHEERWPDEPFCRAGPCCSVRSTRGACFGRHRRSTFEQVRCLTTTHKMKEKVLDSPVAFCGINIYEWKRGIRGGSGMDEGNVQDSTMFVNAFSCLSRWTKRPRMSVSHCGIPWWAIVMVYLSWLVTVGWLVEIRSRLNWSM